MVQKTKLENFVTIPHVVYFNRCRSFLI